MQRQARGGSDAEMLSMIAQTEYFTCLVKDNTRQGDDYVNATNWSKAFGKEWKRYRESVRLKKLTKILMTDYKVGISDLVEVRHGKVHETWASPEIAIDFARSPSRVLLLLAQPSILIFRFRLRLVVSRLLLRGF